MTQQFIDVRGKSVFTLMRQDYGKDVIDDGMSFYYDFECCEDDAVLYIEAKSRESKLVKPKMTMTGIKRMFPEFRIKLGGYIDYGVR
jgi:hypothetical protein